MKKSSIWVVLLSGIIFKPFDVQAVCMPVFDCEELGYTENASQCSGMALKCPWDLTKAACKKDSVSIPTKLPILYGDGTVSKGIVEGKTPIGIVFDETNKLAAALNNITMDGTEGNGGLNRWMQYDVVLESLTVCDGENRFSCDTDGRQNTDKILLCGPACGQTAAGACSKYEPTGCSKDFCKASNWFLPSMKELRDMYTVKDAFDETVVQLRKINISSAEIALEYWSSNRTSTCGGRGVSFFIMETGSHGCALSGAYLNIRPVINFGKTQATCAMALAASGATLIRTESELRSHNGRGFKLLLMNDVDLGNGDIKFFPQYVSWPGEFSQCRDYKRPTITGQNVIIADGEHSFGVNLNVQSLKLSPGAIELSGVNSGKVEDNNGQNVWFYGDVNIGVWVANANSGSSLFNVDGSRRGVVKGGSWGENDNNQIAKIVINKFQNYKNTPIAYNAGWAVLDNVDVTIPSTLFEAISGEIGLQYNAKLTISGAVTNCGSAEPHFSSTDDATNVSCFTVNGNEICPIQKQDGVCKGFSGVLQCHNGNYSCQ